MTVIPRANLKSIAEKAGVSTTTVHDALYGRGRVNAETQARIREIAQGLNYRPNHLARALRLKRSGMLGVVVNDLFFHLFARMLPSIELIANQAGYHVFFACSYGNAAKEQEVIGLLLASGMEGMLLFPAADGVGAYRDLLAKTPVVLIEPPGGDMPGYDSVATDNIAGGDAAVGALLQTGRRHIAFYAPSDLRPDWWARERLEGCARAVARSGGSLAMVTSATAESAVFIRYAARSLEDLRTAGGLVDGIVAANDTLAYQAIRELRGQGHRVPEDVAVVGCDDRDESRISSPPLTSLRQPMERIGETAIRILLSRLQGDTAPAKRHVLAPDLILRGSTGYLPVPGVAVDVGSR